MKFILDIAIFLVTAAISIGLISYIMTRILKFIGIDIPIIKVALFLGVWYFVGPIIYEYLVENIVANQNEVIEYIYMPIQKITELIKV